MNLTTEDVRLLREIVEWRRAEGWMLKPTRKNTTLRTYEHKDGTVQVERHDDVVHVGDRNFELDVYYWRGAGEFHVQLWPQSVTEALDVLTPLLGLPVRFSSAFWIGQGAAAVAVAVEAGTAAARIEQARELARDACASAVKAADAVAERAAAPVEVTTGYESQIWWGDGETEIYDHFGPGVTAETVKASAERKLGPAGDAVVVRAEARSYEQRTYRTAEESLGRFGDWSKAADAVAGRAAAEREVAGNG